MWKCFDSVTMNRYNSNTPINSIMCLSTYESSQSRLKNGSNDSVKSINQLIIYICCRLGKHDISLTFFWKTFDFIDFFEIFWINSIDSIIPVPQSQSTQSPTSWKGMTQSPITSLEKRTESIKSMFREKESIQINQLSRVEWDTSLFWATLYIYIYI